MNSLSERERFLAPAKMLFYVDSIVIYACAISVVSKCAFPHKYKLLHESIFLSE